MRSAVQIPATIAVVLLLLSRPAHGQEFFSQQPIWSTGTDKSGGDGIARFIDFDRDGDLDVVTCAPNPKRWVLYQNQGGKVTLEPVWQSRETTDCDHIDVLDFNHDGWMDLAATHESHCTLYFNQRGRFNVTPDWETGIIANANQIDFGDFDRDGDLDMVMAGGEPVHGVALFLNSNGTPAKTITRKLGHSEYSETAIFADFDRDGDLDIVAGYRAGKIVVYRNSHGAFDDGTVIYEDKANPWTQRVYWRDLDGDARPELFCAKGPWGSQFGTSLQVVQSNGVLPAEIGWASSPQTAFHGFEFHDIDKDGDTDLIAADYADGGHIFLYLNDGGKLAVEPAWSVRTSGPAHEVVLGDIDHDGDLDLAVGCRDQTHIYENLTAPDRPESPGKELLDRAAIRAKALLNAELVFQPCVFFEDEFPRCEFLEPGEARQLLGPYQIDVTFYSKDYQVVTKPSGPGRYGAVVRVEAADGTIYKRFRTLYRSPQRISFFFDRINGELTFPIGTGVDEKTWRNQQRSVNDYVAFAIGRDIRRSHDLAVLLAGLSETDPETGPVSHVESALTKNRRWWLKLKRNLNGNNEIFAREFVGPRVVDGLDAPVLRDGTCEEAGMKPGTVKKIDAVLLDWLDHSDQPFNVCVARRGVVFFHRAYGSRNGEPITTDTRHVVFSITKALSGSLLMMFVHQGVVRLDDPVEKFLPEFQNQLVETPATIRHLFTHTADMEGHFTDHLNDLENVYGEAYPFLAIGKQHKYNGTSIAIGLKVLEQITGLTLPELYKKHLFDPLGCLSIESIDGSAMTWSNAYDLARVGQMLANHGAYGNLRFFDEPTFQQMLPRKLDELLGPDTDVTWGIGLTWFREGGLSRRTIGHGSASSCTLRVDLEKDLVITMTRETAGKNFGQYHRKFIRTVTDAVAD